MIKGIKETEAVLDNSEKIKNAWNNIEKLYLAVNEENYCNKWKYLAQEKLLEPIKKIHIQAIKIAKSHEEQFFTLDNNPKDPGEKIYPDLVPSKLENGEAPEEVYQWLKELDVYLNYAYPSKKNNLPCIKQIMKRKLN